MTILYTMVKDTYTLVNSIYYTYIGALARVQTGVSIYIPHCTVAALLYHNTF